MVVQRQDSHQFFSMTTKQADEKTEKLRDVLTPDQLLQYRQQLLSQYDVILSTMEMTLPTNSDATKE